MALDQNRKSVEANFLATSLSDKRRLHVPLFNFMPIGSIFAL